MEMKTEVEMEMENESLTRPTNLDCGVCLEILDQTDTHDNTDIISKWKCNHYFHKECVANWHHSCPLCRNRECRTEFGGVTLNALVSLCLKKMTKSSITSDWSGV